MDQIIERPSWFTDALNVEHKSTKTNINGANVHFLEWGDPKNQSVIMLHGNHAHAHWFQFIGAMLSHKYHFVVMSFSGMGESDWRSSYERDTFVEDVWGVVNATDMKDPIVVGHSFGGMVSLATGAKYGEFMKGLLLVDFVVYPPEQHEEWFQNRPKSRPPQIRENKEDFTKRFRLMPPQECVNQYLIDFISDRSIRKTEDGWSWTFDPSTYDTLRVGADHADMLANLKCPVGFFYGENTVEFNSKSGVSGMKDLMPQGSPIVALENAQHHLMLDRPKDFVLELEKLIDFFIAQ
jgi:pimeloyl-ACP methyl ester carboxylesterase|tara:strand:+ start:4785 stop:5666 length:882 start_codon:yes stop_codon:yes gene_type:complete